MHRLTLGSLTAALTIALSGCGGDDTTAGRPAPSPSPASSSSAPTGGDPTTPAPSESATPSPTPSPTEAAEPQVAPATGAVLSTEVVSVNAPAAFGDTARQDRTGGTVFNLDNPRNFVELATLEISLVDDSIGSIGNRARTNSLIRPRLKRQPDTTVAGLPAYHLSGPDAAFDGWREEFGFRHRGYTVKVTVNSPLDLPQAERDAIIAPVLASVKLL